MLYVKADVKCHEVQIQSVYNIYLPMGVSSHTLYTNVVISGVVFAVRAVEC